LSSTIFREDGYRYFFFSREEPRMHVHVNCADGEAKYWLEPELELAKNVGIRQAQLRKIEQTIRDHYEEFVAAWRKHFGG
jgi:hypothetical protein